MFQLNTATISSNPDPMECHLELVLGALRQKGMIPSRPPETPFSEVLTLASLQRWYCRKLSAFFARVILSLRA